MRRYRHILFDLDRTLWDFEANSLDTLRELYWEWALWESGIPSLDEFIGVYRTENEACWEALRKGELDKKNTRELRFKRTLERFDNKDDELAGRLADAYLRRTPFKKGLIPNTMELLEGIRDHFYLHIGTNGFTDTQAIKMDRSGLTPYFQEVVTSDGAGFQKPDPRFFDAFLKRIDGARGDCLMVGDDVDVDMEGARRSGIDRVLFDPAKRFNGEASVNLVVMDHLELRDWLMGMITR